MFKAGHTLTTILALSVICRSLISTSGPVANALPIGQIHGQAGKRKLLKTSRLPVKSEFGVVTRTTAEHQVYMKVLFPMGMTPTKEYKIDVTLHHATPAYMKLGNLYSKYKYLLRINPDGTVDGTNDPSSKYAELEFHSVGAGLHMIVGVATRRYLTITDKGLLTAQLQPSLNSVFKEIFLENLYQSFLSYKHQRNGWYVAIKRNGKAKPAVQTFIGQKATQFMTRYES